MLNLILPESGYICVANPLDGGGFKHSFVKNVADAQKLADAMDRAGQTVFIAQASFKTPDNRKGENALALRNFFLDIDCGEGKPYPKQSDGLKALASFCKATKLPFPAVVSSGNGLYAHWPLESSLPASLWRGVALLLKQVVKHYEAGLDADGLVADTARVLRPVGATHRKDKDNPKKVTLVRACEPFNTGNLCRLIKAAFESTGQALAKPKALTPLQNSEFLSGLDEHRPSSAEVIATKCAQIAHIKAVKGDVAEPYWYAVLGLLRFTVESPEVIHLWSMGHTDYTQDGTNAKILQHERSGVGPTTCARISDCNPALCAGCAHVDKIKSPIVLGYAAVEPLVTIVEPCGNELAIPKAPRGWVCSKDGVFYKDDGGDIKVYGRPLFVSSINSDYNGESFTITHQMPFDGWKDVTMASNKVTDAKAFFAALIDAHIQIVEKSQEGLFMSYIKTFMSELREGQRLSKLSGQMGWHSEDDGLAFIQGDSIYRKDGSTHKVGYSVSAPAFIKAIHPEGDMRQWIENTRLLNNDGLEGFAFEFICSAFAAPLVKFSGYEGAMLSIVGGSGLGKTLTGKWGISAWGDPNKLVINQDDTSNAIVGRFGAYNTLPAYIDEVSNITPENLSHLAYRITQGRDKVRLDRNAKEKAMVNVWNLLAVVSSNHSLMDKLLTLKGDPGAEFNRIFEYEIEEGYTSEEGKMIYDGFDGNFGQVGKDYALWLVQNQDKHANALDKYTAYLAKLCDAKPSERFWVMVGACAVYGATAAKSLGLSHVDIAKLIPWIVKTIKDMRKYKAAEGFDETSFLGTLLDKYANGILGFKDYNHKDEYHTVHRMPTGTKLVARIEQDKNRLWVSADVIRQELSKQHLSVRKVAAGMKGKGLLSTSERINLGRGTPLQGVGQIAWMFDLGNPLMGYKIFNIVAEATSGVMHERK